MFLESSNVHSSLSIVLLYRCISAMSQQQFNHIDMTTSNSPHQRLVAHNNTALEANIRYLLSSFLQDEKLHTYHLHVLQASLYFSRHYLLIYYTIYIS